MNKLQSNIKSMKKTVFIFALAVTALIFSGCRNNTFSIETETYEDEFTFTGKWIDTLSMDISIEYPVGGSDKAVAAKIAETMNTYFLNEVPEKTDGMSLEDAVLAYVAQEIEKFDESDNELAAIEKDGDVHYTWQEIISGKFTECSHGIQSYLFNSYSYTGGAHGSSVRSGMNFDITTGEIVSKTDLFEAENDAVLNALVSKAAKDSMEEDTYSMLFSRDLKFPENFYVSEKGVVCIFNQYEIGPYVIGIQEITIPWTELESCIAPKYK